MERLKNARRTLEIQQKFTWVYNTCSRSIILLKGETLSFGATLIFGGKSLPKPRDLPAWGGELEVGQHFERCITEVRILPKTLQLN